MGIFSAKGISKKPVQDWNPDRVERWLCAIGAEPLKTQFRGVTGQRLLKLKPEHIYELTGTKIEGDVVLDAIAELKKREGIPIEDPVSEGENQNTNGSSTTPPAALPPKISVKALNKGRASSIASESGQRLGTPTHTGTPNRTDTPTETRTPFSLSNTQTPTASAHRETAENAAALAQLVGDEDVVTGLFEYLSLLGIQGMGLVEATERASMVGHVIGAIWELHDLVAETKGDRPNCMQLNAYCQDILRVFDAEGKRLAFLDESAMASILALLEKAIRIVESNIRPGWLIRMARNDRSVEEFQAVHNGVLDILRKEKVDTLQNGRQLTYGEYHDASRPLKRFLKQLGSGSLEAGLTFVLQHEDAQENLSQLIGIDKQLVIEDLKYKGSATTDLMSTVGGMSVISGDNLDSNELSGNREREYHTIFAQYDKNNSGALEFEELRSVLADLSLLDNVKPTEIEAYTRQQYDLADADNDGNVSYEDFVHFYQTLTTSKARRELRAVMGPHAEKELKKVFFSFVSFGVRQYTDGMEGAKFNKLCRDCKLFSRDFTTTDVDLIFAKIKLKGHRRIDFDGFLAALLEIADKKRQSLEYLVDQILSAGGPTVTATKADYVKFHDDKSTYTGVYSRGGPTNVEPSKDLSALLDRSEADVRGVKKRSSSTSGSVTRTSSLLRNGSGTSSSVLDTGAHRSGNSSRRESSVGEAQIPEYRRRDSTSGSIDGPRMRSSSYLGEYGSGASVVSSIPPSPLSRGFTGGLPPVKPPSALGRPPQLATPTAAIETREGNAQSSAIRASPGSDVSSSGTSPRPPTEGSFCAPDAIRQLAEESTRASPRQASAASSSLSPKAELKGIFLAYIHFGGRANTDGPAEMDGAKFAKLCRESHLLGAGFTSTSADLVFSKVKAKGARKIDFKAFTKAVDEIARAKNVDVSFVQQQIIASGGPQVSSTTPSCHVRLHDDKSSYTGVYKAGGPSVIDSRITLENLTDRTKPQVPSNKPRMTYH